MATQFEWDAAKAADNVQKHRVSFEEAATVFGDPLGRIFDDPDHSQAEHRELLIGHSTRNHVLVVSFTERAHKIRIISARRATKRERHDYEENSKNSKK
jgi:uncharacterized DUF497 family protein